jgi:3-oxoacyl-[acyl-carrier protein] reductase
MAGLCKERVAVVTGAAGQGMGRSIALTLAREGAAVVVNYLSSEQQASAIVEHITSRGGAALKVKADVASPEGCDALVRESLNRFGKVDICIVGPGGGWHPGPAHEVDVSAAMDDVRRELLPLYALMRLLLPQMYDRQWGRVVAITQLPPYNSPAYAYNAAKAARTQAAMIAQRDAWRKKVTINTVAPGPVDHVEELATAVELCDHGPAWHSREKVTPQDVAEGVAFLCSDAGQFISGCDVPYLWR